MTLEEFIKVYHKHYYRIILSNLKLEKDFGLLGESMGRNLLRKNESDKEIYKSQVDTKDSKVLDKVMRSIEESVISIFN